jgi:type VI secretion system protein ImpM
LNVGLYGKLPSHGDFLRRRVSDAFVEVWDAWLQRCMAASSSALRESWLDVYLTSPAWRFACGPGACGPATVVGLIAPSVDRVGRYFPVTLVAELPDTLSPISAALLTAAFLDSAERLVVDTLAMEQIDFEAFDARVAALGDELGSLEIPRAVVLNSEAAAIVNEAVPRSWRMTIGSPTHLGSVFEQLLSLRLATLYDPLGLWWTEGSSIVEPSCLITSGLPQPDTFAALLNGSWPEHQWWSVSSELQPALDEALVEGAPLRFRSASATDIGKVRESNQDAFLERPEIGLWAVADGLGGHRAGEVASRMVCDALADFDPKTSFDDMIAAARDRMIEVNDQLLRGTLRSPLADRCGSTVAVLLARGGRCAILWAGDSRVYRWRRGRLERLTHDHSVAESDRQPGISESHVVTRAVGVQPSLVLDTCQEDVRAGDRFLLCSDGLTHTLADAQIGEWMASEDVRVAVDGLIRATLDAGAPDNVTVIAVGAST